MTGIVQALTSATDATPSRFAASDLPLYQARDMLEVVERALSAFEGNFVASAPARSDLMATAELAGELLAIFGAVAQQVHPDARRADGTTQIH